MAASPPFPNQGPVSSEHDASETGEGGLVARPSPGDNAEPLSVTEISQALKRVVEDRFGFVRVRGELSGVKRAASGHLYCSLKDEGARLDGVMWKGTVARLSFLPEDGLEVVASGKLTTYPGRSNYQLVIERMEIAGEGALLALLAKTKARLEAEGLFDSTRKRAIPFLPRVIGVVTSPTGAVIRDILHRLADRFPCHVLVWPVLVQGQGAAAQIAAAVRGFSALEAGGPPSPNQVPRPDLVIVARGGGSIEDLWAFNEEEVVRAIADCSIPIISAVGHETDTTLADFAADWRAPTPTAAAERAVPVRADLAALLGDLGLRARRAVGRAIALGAERLEARARHLPAPPDLLPRPAQALDEAGEHLRRGLSDRVLQAGRDCQALSGRLSLPLLRARLGAARASLAGQRLSPALLAKRITQDRARLDGLGRVLQSLNPDAILQKGYVRVTSADGRTLLSAAQAGAEPRLTLRFRDGALGVVPLGMEAAGSGAPGERMPSASGQALSTPRRAAPKSPKPTVPETVPEQGKLL